MDWKICLAGYLTINWLLLIITIGYCEIEKSSAAYNKATTNIKLKAIIGIALLGIFMVLFSLGQYIYFYFKKE